MAGFLVSTILGYCGFGMGLSLGMIIGYFCFIYFKSTDVKDPEITPIPDQDPKTLERLLPEIPLWVKNPDFDRVDWINNIINQMWPYLDKAIPKMVNKVVKPIIDENVAKYFKYGSVDIETLSLGTLPPTFQGMKVYVTDEKELIMEPVLRWAGNPNIIVAAKSYGLKATVQVVDLQVFARPRITLKPLVSVFPCFANVYISLMEKPHVDFGLKLLGADLMSIPGLYILVKDIIKTQVANMLLWPKHISVQIMDPSKATKKPIGILQVKVIKAQKLMKKDLMGKSDPYVKLKLSGDKLPSKKTTVKHNDLNPEWNEEFKLSVTDPHTQILELQVFDWEQVGSHDRLGMNVIPLKNLNPDETKKMTLDLVKTMKSSDDQPQDTKFRGQLEVELTYRPFKEDETSPLTESDEVGKAPEGTPAGGGMLVVIVHEALDLEGKHHTNPYVKLLFRGEQKKTKPMKKNRNPRYEQEFAFMCDSTPTNERLHVEVLSKSSTIRLHPKESLGYIDINLADVVNNRRINEKYHLIDSRTGQIQIELLWKTP